MFQTAYIHICKSLWRIHLILWNTSAFLSHMWSLFKWHYTRGHENCCMGGQKWKPEMGETTKVTLHFKLFGREVLPNACACLCFSQVNYNGCKKLVCYKLLRSFSFLEFIKTFGPVSLWFNFVTASWIYHLMEFSIVFPACHEIDFKISFRRRRGRILPCKKVLNQIPLCSQSAHHWPKPQTTTEPSPFSWRTTKESIPGLREGR